MAEQDLFAGTDKLLAAFDFTSMIAAQNESHRKETVGLLLHFIEIVDGLQELELHCTDLAKRGAQQVPLRPISVLIRRALQMLAAAGVEPMRAAGQSLNLDLHEVEAVLDAASEEADTVLRETTHGYLLRGKLLRRAKVIVASGTQAAENRQIRGESNEGNRD